MKRLQRVRTRRQLFRVTAVSAASIPFLALLESPHQHKYNNNQGKHQPNQQQDQATPAF